MADCRTVGQLIDRLKEFDPEAQLDIYVSFYERGLYTCACRDRGDHPHSGIPVLAYEAEPGIIRVCNAKERDACLYEE